MSALCFRLIDLLGSATIARNANRADWGNVKNGRIAVAELFAGVGGFRLALDGYRDPEHPEFNMPAAGPYDTIWANQWEPPGTKARQFAAQCYETHWPNGTLVNRDIAEVMDLAEEDPRVIPDCDLAVGGFPCQDYSVAKPLSQAGGIEGHKGVLWWEIYRFLSLKEPRFVLLENVDRLLKSPASQRGRDFAIMLSCFASLGYSVEWRVVNSAEYGAPQRRKRVYIFAQLDASKWQLKERLVTDGVLAEALPIKPELEKQIEFDISKDAFEMTRVFGKGDKVSAFRTAGVMQDCRVYSANVTEDYNGPRRTLGDVLVPESEVPEEFFIPADKLEKWEYLKGSKKEERTNKKTGFTYHYSEGSMAFPDLPENPSRTILTGEGGAGASRFKHVVKCESGRYRRLVPDELDQLQCFPKGWTNTGMSDGHRAFCMGNALVVEIPHAIGKTLARRIADGAI